MASFILGVAEFKSYVATIGPDLGRSERPAVCLLCVVCTRIWFNGWRRVFCVVLGDGDGDRVSERFDEGLWLQRVCCAECDGSWTIRPEALYPHRSFQPDVVEAGAIAYLSDPSATYQKTADALGCSPRSVWRWIGWLAHLLDAPAIVSEAEQHFSSGQSAALIPREVPEDHEKARSPERKQVILRAFQGLVALIVWLRAQPITPLDPSPLRVCLAERFLTFRKIHHLVAHNQSPPLPDASIRPP